MNYFRSSQYPIEFILSENINKDFSSHNHANHYIISLCIKGSVTVTLENKPLQLKKNDFFTVPPFTFLFFQGKLPFNQSNQNTIHGI